MESNVETAGPYEPPALTEVGSINTVTQGHWFANGQDSWSWVNGYVGYQLIGS